MVVALAKYTDTLATFYDSHGFEVIKADWIDTYEHTQAVSYSVLNPFGLLYELRQQFNISKARRHTRALVEKIQPDIVHLNSVVLLGSAMEVSAMGVPLVWHVREPSVKGLFGKRTRKIIKALRTLPDRTIFICKADKKSWGDPENGTVVYNFIDFEKFYKTMKAKPEWGIDDSGNTFYVLFLGGMNKVKGTIVMMRAFAKFRALNPGKKIKLIFAAGKYNRPDYFIYKLATGILPRLGRKLKHCSWSPI
jgi:glycosyltransferase involved in cell wall biosynthesis